jgi:hypothetical protein
LPDFARERTFHCRNRTAPGIFRTASIQSSSQFTQRQFALAE